MISTGLKQQVPETTVLRPTALSAAYQLLSNQSQVPSLPASLLPSDLQRKNEKNKFINKLKKLHGETNSYIKTLHRSFPSQSDCAAGAERKERNKIAARESRSRKKLYVKLMQSKIQNLQLEMIKATQEIQQVRLQIFNAEMHQGAQGEEAKHKQLHIIKKLEGLLASQHLEERNNEISICLDSIVYRIGAAGNERKAALKKLYSGLLNFSQPALYRYFLWSAVKKVSIFGHPFNQDQNNWWNQIQTVAASVVETPGLRDKLEQKGKEISEHCCHFQESAEDLVKFRREIQKKGQLLDNAFSEVREVLTPEQVAHLILFVESYQFKREIRLFEDGYDYQAGPSKKTKNQQNSI